jgi:hypothetical protein
MVHIQADISKLSEDLPIEAIQKTDKRNTKKGYDTTGYGYQWCVDRFNNILGEKWGFEFELINEKAGSYKTGTPYYEITVKVTIWINDKENGRSCVGGHTAINYADALKGAITNGFKKTAAFWGVGAKAFRGMIDDDHSLPENDNQKQKSENVKPSDEPKRKLLLKQIDDLMKDILFTDDERKYIDNAVEAGKKENMPNKYFNNILVKYQSELNKRKKEQGDITKQAEKIFDGEAIENFEDNIPGEASQKDLELY